MVGTLDYFKPRPPHVCQSLPYKFPTGQAAKLASTSTHAVASPSNPHSDHFTLSIKKNPLNTTSGVFKKKKEHVTGILTHHPLPLRGLALTIACPFLTKSS